MGKELSTFGLDCKLYQFDSHNPSSSRRIFGHLETGVLLLLTCCLIMLRLAHLLLFLCDLLCLQARSCSLKFLLSFVYSISMLELSSLFQQIEMKRTYVTNCFNQLLLYKSKNKTMLQ